MKYIHKIDQLPELFEKLTYESWKFGASYTAMMFDVNQKSRLFEFWDFLLHYLRISDTVFYYQKTKLLVILEETTLRWALILNEKLREKIKKKWFKYKFYCSSVQWNFIDDSKSLEKALKKRIKKAKECWTTECVHSLSCVN